jgi:hypothetical protein
MIFYSIFNAGQLAQGPPSHLATVLVTAQLRQSKLRKMMQKQTGELMMGRDDERRWVSVNAISKRELLGAASLLVGGVWGAKGKGLYIDSRERG